MVDILECDVGVISISALGVIDTAFDPMVRLAVAAKAKNDYETADRMLPQCRIGIVLVERNPSGWCIQWRPHPIDPAANRVAASGNGDNAFAVLSQPTAGNAIPGPGKTRHRGKNRQTNPQPQDAISFRLFRYASAE